MGELKNCKNCNRIFTSYDGNLFCEKCQAEGEETYKKIRDYLYENPGVSVLHLATKFDISISWINQYIKEGRFIVSPPEQNK